MTSMKWGRKAYQRDLGSQRAEKIQVGLRRRRASGYREGMSLVSEKPRRLRFGSLRRCFDNRSFLCVPEGEVGRMCGAGKRR